MSIATTDQTRGDADTTTARRTAPLAHARSQHLRPVPDVRTTADRAFERSNVDTTQAVPIEAGPGDHSLEVVIARVI